VSVTVLYGELRTGRITGSIDVTTAPWSVVANGPGRIKTEIAEHIVRDLDLRNNAQAARCFLAVDVDGRIQEAGPIWSRTWNDDDGVLTLGAAGLWSLFDHRHVLELADAGTPIQSRSVTLDTLTLGGIGKGLVALAMQWAGGNLPLVMGIGATAGDHTETFPGWKLLKVGDQLRELTAREAGAPDIRFRPRYQADRRFIEWVMDTGDEDQPLLTQVGADWVFDATARKGPVVSINTDEDATVMGMWAFETGQGNEEDTLMAWAYDRTLVDAGWPLLEVSELRSTVSDLGTLSGHADNLLARSARPIETWTVTVRAAAAAEVLPGDYCQVVPRTSSAWLGLEGTAFMRVKTKSGDLGDNIKLEMYAVAGRL